ncbi:MAG TPA: hypothetical protein PKC87_00160 [Candidatus Absconditabacterales bacterium]|nr:hypothetical protein [Candidatus Absconditabacterales bacterium]
MIKGKKLETENYVQVTLKSGKIHPKLFKNPQRAIRIIGVENILKLREIPKDQVKISYSGVDAITGTPEESL